MELLQLKYFQTVAYTEHISKAAAQLNIAQPSLSLTIKRLEDEMGTPLFHRKGRNIELNAAGKILLKHVNRIFVELENARLAIKEKHDELSSLIRIAISNSRFLSGLISEYIEVCPSAQLQQGIASRSDIVTQLKKGDIDLGITGHPIVDEEIVSVVLVEEHIVLVLPSTHPYSGEQEISLHAVANEPFLALANNDEYRRFTTMLCEKAGFVPHLAFEVDSHTLVEIIRLDRGVALLPISVCRNLGLHYVSITDDAAVYPISLSWVKHRNFSPFLEQFRDFITSYYMTNASMFKV
ncbi:LysR family transcriptional regulator [Paenibacillus silvae]|uniref:LysR family transcriptional regulator n=1 Tax=Paenibacillus silvae TaxID=1325358 RepID=UPI0020047418|nr:LysR family transcriptional regulator [Paenibacillus silvae]MCK6073381.1 LysR family transcriptional regulator [Paenibacillus silvae]MCK6149143.1 LysR family transcriptional regulator [Paenibacillus silvae]MCK6267442.1 LysR family transcriptional regulator [Paenibacillus silvae]